MTSGSDFFFFIFRSAFLFLPLCIGFLVGRQEDCSSCQFTQVQVQVQEKRINPLPQLLNKVSKPVLTGLIELAGGSPVPNDFCRGQGLCPGGEFRPDHVDCVYQRAGPPDEFSCWSKGKWMLRKSNKYSPQCTSAYLSEGSFLFSLMPNNGGRVELYSGK